MGKGKRTHAPGDHGFEEAVGITLVGLVIAVVIDIAAFGWTLLMPLYAFFMPFIGGVNLLPFTFLSGIWYWSAKKTNGNSKQRLLFSAIAISLVLLSGIDSYLLGASVLNTKSSAPGFDLMAASMKSFLALAIIFPTAWILQVLFLKLNSSKKLQQFDEWRHLIWKWAMGASVLSAVAGGILAKWL